MNSTKNSFKEGIFFTAIAKYSNVFLTIVIGAILARILTPEEFGIVAIVTVFVSFFNLLSDLGIGPAIIQNQSLNKKDIESIFLFTIFIGISFGAFFYISSSVIANFYERPELINVVRLMSLSIVFYALQVVPMAMCQKNLRFKNLGLVNISVQIITGSIAIILAYNGFSYYSLVVKIILDGIFNFLGFYLLNPIKFTFKINFISLSKIAKFSTFQFLFNFINYFSRNSDNLLIGKFLGLTPLGFYDKSYRLMMMPIMNITHVISPVLLPVLAKFNNDKKRVYEAYLKVLKLLSYIGFPLSVFLFFSSKEIILIIFGSQWTESIAVFKILSLTVGIQIVLSSTGSIFQALNKANLLFLSGFFSAIIMIGAISYGVFIGKSLEDIGYSLIIAFILNFIISFYILISKVLEQSFFIFLKSFVKPLSVSLFVFIGLYFTSYFVSLNIYISLLVKVFVAAFIFVIGVSLFDDNYAKMKEKLNSFIFKK